MRIEKYCGVYLIRNKINNKIYIGISKDIYLRWDQHRSELRNNKHHNKYLQRSWNKYGEDNFEFKIIEKCDIDDLKDFEYIYITTFNSIDKNYGYNLTPGGEFNIMSIETRDKISKSKKGIKMSEDTKRNMSLSKNKKIVQLSLNGDLINIWESGISITNELKINSVNIGECCRKSNPRRKTAFGYIWLFYDDYINNNYDINYYHNLQTNQSIKVEQYDLNNNYINTYDSIFQAGKLCNIPSQNIRKCTQGFIKRAGNYIWKISS